MAHDKSKIVEEVLRANFGHCFHYVEKPAALGGCNSVPPVAQARRTPFADVTAVVNDISILMNKFRMGAHQPSGRELVDFLLTDAKRAFEHERIHTVVLCADMSCFSVEAKEVLQADRLKQAQSAAARERVTPYQWDINNPTQILDLNRPAPSLVAMQAAPGVLRQVLYEALTLIPVVYTPPAGKRLILHMEPRLYTNPSSLAEFMPNDPATGIVICEDRRAEVEAQRDELRGLVSQLTTRDWRQLARERTTALSRAGCFQTIPLCYETSKLGVTYEPFRLTRMRFQAGEADLSIQRYIPYLYTGAIVDRLIGDRRPRSGEAFSQFYTAEQLAATRAALPTPGPYEFYVGEGGRQCVQRTAVLSVDSDFCGLLTFTLAQLSANHDSGTHESGFDVIAPHAPLLVRGTVLTQTRETLPRGERRRYYPDGAERAQALLRSYELFDPAAFYADLVRVGPPGPSPLALVAADAKRRQEKTAALRKTNAAAKKRALETDTTAADDRGGGGGGKRQAAGGGAYIRIGAPPVPLAAADDGGDEDGEDAPGPIIHMPGMAAGASNDELFERVASFVMFTCLCGNDYLGGVHGVPRRWAYAAYAEMVLHYPREPLVRVLRLPGVNDRGADGKTLAAPLLPLVVDAGVHERLLGYCYYMNLVAQPCATNKPTQLPHTLSVDEIARLVVSKYSKANKQVPTADRRHRMWLRLLWVLFYFNKGTTNIRNIIDPLECGWEGEWRAQIV